MQDLDRARDAWRDAELELRRAEERSKHAQEVMDAAQRKACAGFTPDTTAAHVARAMASALTCGRHYLTHYAVKEPELRSQLEQGFPDVEIVTFRSRRAEYEELMKFRLLTDSAAADCFEYYIEFRIHENPRVKACRQ